MSWVKEKGEVNAGIAGKRGAEKRIARSRKDLVRARVPAKGEMARREAAKDTMPLGETKERERDFPTRECGIRAQRERGDIKGIVGIAGRFATIAQRHSDPWGKQKDRPCPACLRRINRWIPKTRTR